MKTEQIKEILAMLQSLLTTFVPIAITIFYTVRDKIKETKRDLDKQKTAENVEKYRAWEHDESIRVITKIKNLCNYYKDKGHMDLVEYVQLENGTVASSKLCNMFVSCLAEDDRFGPVPKFIDAIKRIPYSQVSEFVGNLELCRVNGTKVLRFDDIVDLHKSASFIPKDSNVHSVLATPIYDLNNLFIGFGMYYYSESKYNGMDFRKQKNDILKFSSAIEAIFFDYHSSRLEKMKELNLNIVDLN